MSGSAPTNALVNETSPYLLQHADNPVDWQPWGLEALERARREDKPILLSIGYSACHWCHVMAHESFEDEDTARLMNALYVNIKVDREERPDIDRIYQTAHQLLARRTGGWPLTVVLTPDDHAPFFAGTYFPDSPRHGMPSFRQVLDGVARLYRERRDDIRRQNASLVEALASLEPAIGAEAGATPLTDAPLRAARAALMQSYDPRHGGFGDAPKFPHPTNLERLMRGPCGASRERGRRRRPRGRHVHVAQDVRRRPVRPRGRRVLPLFGGCRVDDPALREDALRQRAAPLGGGGAVSDLR